jgi:hypothetical protein
VRAPKVAKKSPAQVRAGQAFTAGGRAAQRKAASNPKTVAAEHAKRSAASRKSAATSARNSALRKSGKKVPTQAQKRAATIADAGFQMEAGPLPGWSWLMACNDYAPTCAAAAVANHLLAVTGFAMADDDILRLHAMAGGDDGADIPAVLEVMRGFDYALFSRTRLARFTRTDEDVIVSGLIVGVRLGHAGHAVVSTPRGMVSWGREMPFAGVVEEAWDLEWAW